MTSQDSTDKLAPVRRALLDTARARDLLWTSGGTQALWVALATVRRHRGEEGRNEVLVPAAACLNVALAVIYAGLSPRFADVDSETALLTADAVAACLTDRTLAVVCVHLYGQSVDVDSIRAVVGPEVAVVEDAAQATLGILPDGNPIGSGGDFVVHSFNATKIVETGGGALLMREPGLAPTAEAILSGICGHTALDPDFTTTLAASQRDVYMGLSAGMRTGHLDRRAPFFESLVSGWRDLYRQARIPGDRLADAWQGIEWNIDHRLEMAASYHEGLQGLPLVRPGGWRASQQIWRYSVLADTAADARRILMGLRRAGFLASDHYWPLTFFFPGRDETPRAESYAERVVNLWVDGKVDDAAVRSTCREIGRICKAC